MKNIMIGARALPGLLLATLILVVGCDSSAGAEVVPGPQGGAGAGVPGPVIFGGDHSGYAESTLSRADIASAFTVDGDWLISPPLEAPDGATRVGALIYLATPGDMPSLEAAGIDAQGASSGWLPLGQTYGEDGAFVGVAELGETVGVARLRLRAGDMDRISQLVWSAVVPADEASGLGTVEGGLTSDLVALGVTPRSAWKARPTKCTAKDLAKTRMAVHYTVTPADNPMARVRSIQAYHMDSLGWCDIGYHFLVGADGTAYEGRPIDKLGAHTGGQNSANIGVSFIGCFHPNGCSTWKPLEPPQVMLDAGALLLGALAKTYTIPLDTSHVKGHRDHAGQSTSCPGDYLEVHIPALLATAAGKTPPGGETPGGETPGGETPGGETPGGETPGGETPGGQPTSCGGLACGQCASTAGCTYCASQGACLPAGTSCQWPGTVALLKCWSELWPCWIASCWNPTAELKACGTWTQDEDYSSGKFSVHRYWATLPGDGITTLRFERLAGDLAPAVLVTDSAGALISAGEIGALHPTVKVVSAVSGRSGGIAEVSLHTKSDQQVLIYVTGWSVLDAGFAGSLSKATKYRLSAVHDCGATPPAPAGAQSDPWAGLSQGGAEIPRKGLTNPTLKSTLGLATEPYGGVAVVGGRPWVQGGISWFGGPTDTGVSATETGAITGETLRKLNDPMNPTAADLAARPEDFYYCAMRWSYVPNGASFWKGARILVRNPETGAAVVLRPLDWGPNTSTKRVIDVSPQAIADLGVLTDDDVQVAFAAPGTPLGPVQPLWAPAPGTTWQWQLSGVLDPSVDAAVYDVDLFDTPASTIAALQGQGRHVICYFSAGSFEEWRPDVTNFPTAAIGAPLDGWPGERWLDVRNEQVRAAMKVRLDLAAQKGCDAVEPDNVDGYSNVTGFPLSAAHQTDFNTFLAAEAHARGLSVGLKNALGLAQALQPHFDWALNEECHANDECAFLKVFVDNGKAVLHVEYVETAAQAPALAAAICGAPDLAGFSTLIKTWELDASRVACP